ncbi:MAG TPA: hypothetical protein VI299_29310 [Polyangiales bacterium]
MYGLIALLGAYYLVSQGFDSTLRWAFDLVKAAPLIYARDGAMIIAIVLGFVDVVANRRDALLSFGLLTFILVGAVIGGASGLPLQQVLFGIKVWLPLLLGMAMASEGVAELLDRPRVWGAIWALLVVGILLNLFVKYPWTGMTMQVGDTQVEANREWDTGGFSRVSGFSRTSFDAAICVILLGFYLVLRSPSLLVRAVVWLLTGASVVLTTTKGAVGAWLVATPILPLILGVKPLDTQRFRRTLAFSAVTVLALFAALTPLISTQMQWGVLEEGTVEFFLFASFGDRITNTWPSAFKLLDAWQFVTGRGVGGIGAAQTYFELDTFCPADSFFVYVYVTAGLVGAALYFAMLAGMWQLNLSRFAGRLTYCILLFVFVYGLTVNVVESAVALMAVGAAAAQLVKREPGYAYAPQYVYS